MVEEARLLPVDSRQLSIGNPPADPKDRASIKVASDLLLHGDIVAIPTETVYGLAADATNQSAVMKIFECKNRPSDNPLIVHIDSIDMALKYCCTHIPDIYKPLLDAYWPGPLTILVPRSSNIAPAVSGPDTSITTIGIRMPSDPVMWTIINTCGRPLAAPSANRSGKPSPTCARHVLADFGEGGLLRAVIDDKGVDGCRYGVESTVVDATFTRYDTPVVLRPGAITIEMIRSIPAFENTAIGVHTVGDHDNNNSVTTPGMKYRHYSPVDALVILFEGNGSIADGFIKFLNDKPPCKIGIIRTRPIECLNNIVDIDTSSRQFSVTNQILNSGHEVTDYRINPLSNEAESFARHLFGALRYLDEEIKTQYILVHGVEERGLGAALMNRLRKAAHTIIEI
eukprot:Partr_v1_DN24972_c0_g1_i1_m45473 putative yrdC domain containing (E. coli)